MAYVPPFEAIKNRFTFTTEKGKVQVSIPYDELLEIIKLYLRGVTVDEDWYKDRYPDIVGHIKSGALKNAKNHYVDDGYFEGRMPAPAEVDEDYYLAENPDIAAEIEKGNIASATDHFIEHGYAEGRLPAAY